MIEKVFKSSNKSSRLLAIFTPYGKGEPLYSSNGANILRSNKDVMMKVFKKEDCYRVVYEENGEIYIINASEVSLTYSSDNILTVKIFEWQKLPSSKLYLGVLF